MYDWIACNNNIDIRVDSYSAVGITTLSEEEMFLMSKENISRPVGVASHR